MKRFFAPIAVFALIAVLNKLISVFLYDGSLAADTHIFITFIVMMLVDSQFEMAKIRKQLEEIKAKQ